MYHPIVCILGVVLSFILTGAIFRQTSLDPDQFFYLPIVLLIAFYTVISMVTDRKVYERRTARQAIRKALPKFIFCGVVIWLFLQLYDHHPFYSWFAANSKVLVRHFFYAYLCAGLPYFFLEEKYRYCVDNALGDPYVRLVALLKQARNRDFGRFKRRLTAARNRSTILSWLIRVHYLPVMAEQVHVGMTTIDWHNLLYDRSTPYLIFLLESFAWMVDSNNASIGYFWQSSFTKTRFRGVDPHPSHWIVVLSCYMPFNTFVQSTFIPFPAISDESRRLFTGVTANSAIDLAVVVALVMVVVCTSTLGFSYSNLSYKAIQTRGPYWLCRHPATTCKIAYFSLSFLRFTDAYSLSWMVCYVYWMGIYVLRTILEERYLRRFPEYRDYMKRTRYRLIPGIV